MAIADLPQIGADEGGGYTRPDCPHPQHLQRRPAFREAYPDAVPNDYGYYDRLPEGHGRGADHGLADFGAHTEVQGQRHHPDLDRPAPAWLAFGDRQYDQRNGAAEAFDALIGLARPRPFDQYLHGPAKGTVAMAQCANYDMAMAQASSKDVAYVVPSEGTTGYFEGFCPVAGSKELDVVHAFLNFHLDPKIYADFVNTTGSAWVEAAAEPYIEPSSWRAPR
jgi:hypothetical protein